MHVALSRASRAEGVATPSAQQHLIALRDAPSRPLNRTAGCKPHHAVYRQARTVETDRIGEANHMQLAPWATEKPGSCWQQQPATALKSQIMIVPALATVAEAPCVSARQASVPAAPSVRQASVPAAPSVRQASVPAAPSVRQPSVPAAPSASTGLHSAQAAHLAQKSRETRIEAAKQRLEARYCGANAQIRRGSADSRNLQSVPLTVVRQTGSTASAKGALEGHGWSNAVELAAGVLQGLRDEIHDEDVESSEEASTTETNYTACSIVALRTQPATFCSVSASLLICASRQRFVVRRVMYHLAGIFGWDRHTTAGVKRPGST